MSLTAVGILIAGACSGTTRAPKPAASATPSSTMAATSPGKTTPQLSSPNTTVPPNPVGSPPGIVFVDDLHGWASGNGGLVATVDGGRSWHLQYSSTPKNMASGTLTGVGALYFIDVRHGWAVDGGTLIATSDGGLVWRAVGKPDALEGAAQLRFFDVRHGWTTVYRSPCSIAGDCVTLGSMLATVDGGLTWKPAAVTGPVLAMCWANPSTGWAGGGKVLQATTDGGRTWRSMTLPGFYPPPANPNQGAGTSITSIACSEETAWVFGAQGVALGSEGYTIDRTLDDGTHWQAVLGGVNHDPELPGIGNYGGPISAPAPLVAYFVGFCPNCNPLETSITATKDGGQSYRHYRVNPSGTPTGPGFSPVAVSFPDRTHGWVLGSVTGLNQSPTGAIYATTDGGRTWHQQYQSSMLLLAEVAG